jgi:hypothetical protein
VDWSRVARDRDRCERGNKPSGTVKGEESLNR